MFIIDGVKVGSILVEEEPDEPKGEEVAAPKTSSAKAPAPDKGTA